MPKKHVIQLSAEEQKTLDSLLNKGKISARVLKRAHILRLVVAGKSDAEIETALGVADVTIYRTRKRYLEGGLERALYEKSRPGNPRLLDEGGEAMLVALSCSETPHGEERWTLTMLAERLVGWTVSARIR